MCLNVKARYRWGLKQQMTRRFLSSSTPPAARPTRPCDSPPSRQAPLKVHINHEFPLAICHAIPRIIFFFSKIVIIIACSARSLPNLPAAFHLVLAALNIGIFEEKKLISCLEQRLHYGAKKATFIQGSPRVTPTTSPGVFRPMRATSVQKRTPPLLKIINYR